MRLSVETKVGMLFLAGLAILAVVTFKVEDMGTLLQRKKTIWLQVEQATGLEKGDTVAIAGVKVGEIKEVILRDRDIKVVMSIDAKASVKKSARAKVAWGGLLGDRYIDITLGEPGDTEELEPGAQILTMDSIELNELFDDIKVAAAKIGDLVGRDGAGGKFGQVMDSILTIADDVKNEEGTVGKLIGSPELYNEIVEVAADLKATITRVSKLVEDNEERISGVVEGLEAAVPEAKDAFATINRLGKEVESGEGVLPALLTDKTIREDVKKALTRINSAVDNIEAFAKSLKEGDGLAARLSSDEQLAEDFAEAVRSVKAVAAGLEKGDGTIALLLREEDLYVEFKKLVGDARETLRAIKDQVPVGTFASVLLSAF